MKITPQNLEKFTRETLRRAGLNQADADVVADILVTTDTWGVFTHGTKSLRGYIRRLQAGGLRASACPRVVSEGPAWAVVDADSAIGMVGSRFAMETAMAKARRAGIGYVGVRNSCHFGAAGAYAVMAAKVGMIGLAMANDTPSVTVPGARGPVLGSNPLAFAAPTGERFPLMLDMATSAVAGGKVYAAAAHGQSIPPNWIVDADGLPTTDPKIFPHAAALLPMAGHKGYGVALLIETLAGVLTGAALAAQVLSWAFGEATAPTDHGAAFIAIDVNQIMPQDRFTERMQGLLQQIRSAPKAAGSERIYVPGEMEWERRERALVEGLDLPEDVAAPLRLLAAELGMEIG
jgi:ureidoglycolate dehydrogenase (NAD+)